MTLHLTGCWYPRNDEWLDDILTDETARLVSHLVQCGGNEIDVWYSLYRLCADALERMAGTPKETT